MMKENQTQSLGKLGLPPMELAESIQNGRHITNELRCSFPLLQKLIMMILLVVLGAGIYVLLMKLLEYSKPIHSTEVIVVTAIENNPNITNQEEMEVILNHENKTQGSNKIRKKRHAVSATETRAGDSEEILAFNEYQLQIAKDMIMQHNLLCQQDNNEEACQTLIKKLKKIAESNQIKQMKNKDLIENYSKSKLERDNRRNDNYIKEKNKNLKSDVLKKREAFPSAQLQSIIESVPHIESRGNYGYEYTNPANIVPQQHQAPLTQLTDTCLLARLLKHNYPHVHGIYDSSITEYSAPHYENPTSSPHTRYYPPIPSPSYIHGRDIETRKTKLHPQDVDIFMSFLTPKPMFSNDTSSNLTTSRDTKCLPGTILCDTESICISEKQWCDGNVDCPNANDEVSCGCKSRVDKARLCDGYFDCPFGEDEMGCFGCQENGFSCDDLDINSKTSCFTKDQRCDNVADCPNLKDEVECTMLAPGLLKKSLFAISNTEGFLHRNFKGNWHAVCKNPYMWAHDACRRETGIIIRPPFIQILQIDPLLKVNYVNIGHEGLLEIADTCFNSSAIYVTCPDLLCGTRVLSTSQLLRENAVIENNLFGRNKRFLEFRNPYPLVFYENRKKRQTNIYMNETLDNYFDRELLYHQALDYMRNRRAQSRVVGGRPSLPAAWPWMVAIYRNGMFHCGGVLITQNWIMSAAHCVHKFWDHYYEVQVGMLRRFSFSPQEHNHKVTHVIVNQHYRQEDMKNDLSLLRVEPVIQFSRWVRPICLPGPDTAGPEWLWGPSPDTTCTAVGWGATIENGPDPDHMREVEVPIWEHCKHREDRAGKEICAGPVEGGKDACQGDSGGPLLCRNPFNSQQWYIAGIVSHGDGCARKDEPGVYTRVSLFVKWIRYHISSKSLPIVMPIQECPGFKCKSGLPKCIPNKRKCDKIVDCLDAEDEFGCNNTKSSNNFSGNNIFLTEMFKSNDNNGTIEKSRKTKDTAADVTDVIDIMSNIDTTETFSKATVEDPVTTTITWQTESSNDKIIANTTKTNPKTKEIESTGTFEDDFSHASTLEMIQDSKDSERSSQVVSENLLTSTTSEERENVRHENQDGDLNPNLNMNIEDHEWNSIESTTHESLFFTNTVTTESSTTEQSNEQNKQFTTTINLNQNILDSNADAHDSISNSKDEISEKSTEEVEDKFEQNTETTVLNQTSEEHDKMEIKSNEKQTDNTEISIFNDNDQEVAATALTDFVNQSNTIEKYVFSELEPAKIRRKHLIPKEFECRRIFQVIPYSQRCNHKAECEDGTDELDCSCVDYMSTFDVNILCDGIFDCVDGQDEIDCYTCPEEHFLCKRSLKCIHMKYVCDGKFHCPQGEDEIDCYALSNGKELQYGTDKRPTINIEGYFTKRHENEWHVICDDKMTFQEIDQSATHICQYLGFSSANRYFIKYINVKEDQTLEASSEIIRKKREVEGVPVHFSYRDVNIVNKTARQIILKDPQVIEETCVPNITKTCKSLFVICDRSLFTDFNTTKELSFTQKIDIHSNYMWPWIAKVFVEGEYKCTGVLVDLSLVIASYSCLWETSSHSFISVVLGSHKTLNTTNGLYEQIYRVDGKKDLYRSKISLLHLKEPAKYSNMVKPMIVSKFYYQSEQSHICVAVGQDDNNTTLNVFLEETNIKCNSHNVCFKRKGTDNICPTNVVSKRQWAGIISCHSEQGWNPAASFIDSRGECGLGDHINATDIENLKHEIKFFRKKKIFSDSMEQGDNYCEGQRCSRGRCINVHHLCDGIRQCEDGIDESEEACQKKHKICGHDPYHKGCGCTTGEMKCRNGKCISKELFKDGRDDCGDGTDEPIDTTCSDYLARVMPSRLCDGILHCHDRSDENPMFCKCYAKRTYKCGKKMNDIDRCVAPDMVCDGIRDCPSGEDEQTCIGLSAPDGTLYGSGQVMIRSHGVWYSKCYSSPNHTKSELEAICRELGFLSGHAKEIKEMDNHPHNNLVLHPFSEVVLNNNTVIKIRNTDEPVAKPVFNENLKDCYPVFIECI